MSTELLFQHRRLLRWSNNTKTRSAICWARDVKHDIAILRQLLRCIGEKLTLLRFIPKQFTGNSRKPWCKEKNDPHSCYSCHPQNFQYAGAQDGNSCFCDNSYGYFGTSPTCLITGATRKKCAGNSPTNSVCGSTTANTVLQVIGTSQLEFYWRTS